MQICTVFESPQGSKQIVYDLVPGGIAYEVDDEKIKELERVPLQRVQELINFICLTSCRIHAQ